MNREIKFRAWDKDGGEVMLAVHCIDWDKKAIRFSAAAEEWRNLRDLVLMQFTGLHDKSEKEIYEGDVVKAKWGGIGFVECEDGSFEYVFESGAVRMVTTQKHTEERELEVIGNIYENPELVKAKVEIKTKRRND